MNLRIRLPAATVVSNVAVRVLILELVRAQVGLRAELVQEPLVARVWLVFWPAERLTSPPDVAVQVLEPPVVVEVERVPADQRRAVRRSVDRRV